MQRSPDLFKDSFVSELFGLDKRGVNYMMNNSPQISRYRLMLLEVWAQLFLRDVAKSIVADQLKKHISILKHPIN